MTVMSTGITRQIVLDTETTGMNQIGAHYEGHKIIEIGAVEVVNRRLTGNNFHVYLKPDRLVDPEAFGVHEIDNSKRTLHGALLDAQILADVYLMMTGGQTTMAFSMEGDSQQQNDTGIQRIVRQSSKLRVVFATDEELAAHESRLDLVQKKGGSCLWRA